jgi:hypothetical protein
MRLAKMVMVALLAASIVWSETTAADFLNADAEGWHTWQLDGAGHVQIYALIKNRRPAKIRVLSSECPVSTETKLTDHGVASAEDTVEWFRGVIEDAGTNQDIREEALFGLVQSESDAAFEYIDRLLSRR